MNIQKLSRERKEKLYIEKETELQLHWKNSLSSDLYFWECLSCFFLV